ncbi:12985_t:CDS:2, partial [Gigaspora rosea]
MDFIGLPTNYDCDDYENSSIGWNPSEKLKELSEAGARYLIARQVHTINNNVIIGNPIGFVMFQFTFEETMADDDSKIETIY